MSYLILRGLNDELLKVRKSIEKLNMSVYELLFEFFFCRGVSDERRKRIKLEVEEMNEEIGILTMDMKDIVNEMLYLI